MSKTSPQVKTWDKVGYGLGDLGNGMAMQIIGSYLTFFITSILHVPGTISGLAIGVIIFWDAVTDPIMGYISDRTRSKRFGRRHLYLLIGSIGAAISILVLFFIPPESELTFKVILIFIFILAYKTFITILVTPYTALGAELASDYDERTRIQSIRAVFFMFGVAAIMVAGLFLFFQPTPEYPVGQLNPAGYRNLALFTAVMTIGMILIAYKSTQKYIPRLNEHHFETEEGHSFKQLILSFISSFKNKAFRLVAISYMFNNIATAFVNNIGLHVFTYTFLMDNTMISTVLALQFVFAVLSQPLWIIVTKLLDKRNTVIMALSITVFGALYFLVLVLFNDFIGANLWWFIPYGVLGGIGTGALFSIPASMVADTIDVEELETGNRNEGVYFGSMTFAYKVAQAITVFIIGISLDLIGFKSGLAVQSEMTQIGLGAIMALGASLAFIASISILRHYPLTKPMILEIQNKLKIKAKG